MSGSKNVNKNSTNLYCGCVLSFCESKCSQSCGVVSTRSAFCWSLSVTHTHTEAADYIHAHNTHSSICMAFALSLSLSVSTPAEILPPHCCSESPPFSETLGLQESTLLFILPPSLCLFFSAIRTHFLRLSEVHRKSLECLSKQLQ